MPLSSILDLIIFIVFKQARVRTTHAVTGLAKGLYFVKARNFESHLQSRQGLMMMIIHSLSSAPVHPSVCLSMNWCQRLKRCRNLMKYGLGVTDNFFHVSVSFVKLAQLTVLKDLSQFILTLSTSLDQVGWNLVQVTFTKCRCVFVFYLCYLCA